MRTVHTTTLPPTLVRTVVLPSLSRRHRMNRTLNTQPAVSNTLPTDYLDTASYQLYVCEDSCESPTEGLRTVIHYLPHHRGEYYCTSTTGSTEHHTQRFITMPEKHKEKMSIGTFQQRFLDASIAFLPLIPPASLLFHRLSLWWAKEPHSKQELVLSMVRPDGWSIENQLLAYVSLAIIGFAATNHLIPNIKVRMIFIFLGLPEKLAFS